jgi:hypothetical protein
MRVYLAGRIRGIDDYHERFAAAAAKLRLAGHSVFNCAAANQEGRELKDIMAFLLPQLCHSEAIALQRWWWLRFGGSWIEFLLAKYLKLKVIKI